MSSLPTALVTGASSGIGQAIATRLARTGYHVFGTSRAPELVASPPAGVELLTLDVTSDASVVACVQTVLERSGRIDLLVNNAGYALMGAVEETSLLEAQALFETDFFGVVRMTRAVLPIMRDQKQGKVILMGVVLGLIGQPFGAFLSAAKHALEGLAESLYYEVQPFGVSVSILEPAFVATNADQAMLLTKQSLDVYTPVRNQVIAKFRQDLHAGMSPDQVARNVERIAHSRHPHLRYPVGAQVSLISTMKHLLPDRIFASIARNAYGL